MKIIMAVTIREFDVCTSYGEWDRLHGLTGSRNARKSVHGEGRIWYRWEVRIKNGRPLFRENNNNRHWPWISSSPILSIRGRACKVLSHVL